MLLLGNSFFWIRLMLFRRFCWMIPDLIGGHECRLIRCYFVVLSFQFPRGCSRFFLFKNHLWFSGAITLGSKNSIVDAKCYIIRKRKLHILLIVFLPYCTFLVVGLYLGKILQQQCSSVQGRSQIFIFEKKTKVIKQTRNTKLARPL